MLNMYVFKKVQSWCSNTEIILEHLFTIQCITGINKPQKILGPTFKLFTDSSSSLLKPFNVQCPKAAGP